MEVPQLVDRLRSHYEDGCFACGRLNPIGLHLDDFRVEDGEVVASFTPRPQYRGIPNVLHGGVAAAALDEMLVWAGILTEGVVSVTASFELKFRQPSPVEGLLQVRSRVTERRGRRLRATAEITSIGTTTAEAQGLLVVTQQIEDLLSFP